MKESINRIKVLLIRNIKEILRDPLSLIFTIVFPLVMEVLFYLIFHNLTTQFEMKYLAPGIIVFSQAFLTLFIGILISTDRNTSFLTRLYVSKAKGFEFIIAYALSVIPIILIQTVLFLLIGVIFDNSLLSFKLLLVIPLSIVTSLFFISIGILFGTICSQKSIGGISSIAIAGQSVLSGMWFPTEGLGNTMLVLMKILPFKNSVMVIQNIILGINNPFQDFLLPLIIVLSYSIVIFIIAIILFKKQMKAK